MNVTLDTTSVEAIAYRVAELLRGEDVTGELVDAAEIARRFNVGRSWVYEHAEQLGAIPLGSGPRARLRFSGAAVADFFAKRAAPIPEQPKQRTRRRACRPHPGAELLPIRGTGR